MTNKATINSANVIAYITGKLRYILYYSRFRFLIRTHIQEQIDLRVKYMNKECYENGECVICGCQTIALQMAKKACDKPCYFPMVRRHEWKWFKSGNSLHFDDYSWSLGVNGNLLRKKRANGNTLVEILEPNNYV